jgi:serine/threonine protein kinase
VLDLYKGKSLDQYLDEEGKLDETKASIILTGVMSGISYLTSKNIMHRDIKLQNILFKKKEKKLSTQNLIIVDFGLAQYEKDEKYIYTRCGTPGYVAPEVLKAKDPKSRYTCACDVFSAGILLHLLYFLFY